MTLFVDENNVTPSGFFTKSIISSTVELSEEDAKDVLELVDKLEQDNDVQKVYHN